MNIFLPSFLLSHFGKAWWFWLASTGLSLGCALSCKWVGTFVILYVGLLTVNEIKGVLL